MCYDSVCRKVHCHFLSFLGQSCQSVSTLVLYDKIHMNEQLSLLFELKVKCIFQDPGGLDIHVFPLTINQTYYYSTPT